MAVKLNSYPVTNSRCLNVKKNYSYRLTLLIAHVTLLGISWKSLLLSNKTVLYHYLLDSSSLILWLQNLEQIFGFGAQTKCK